MADLDELDKAILRELQRDARRTNRDIAAAVGVSPTTALDRTRSLRERGVIRGALLDVDLPARSGVRVQALIAVRIRPPSRQVIEAFRNWVRQLPDTIGVFVVSGSEDFLIHVAVPDNNSLYAFRRRPTHPTPRGRRRPHQRRLRAPAQHADHSWQLTRRARRCPRRRGRRFNTWPGWPGLGHHSGHAAGLLDHR